MAADKSSILFDGGKRIKLSTATLAGNEGIKMTRNADGSWSININAIISADEARVVIFKFSELKPPAGTVFDDAFPNMTYFSGMDSNEQSIFVRFAANTEILPAFDRDLGGSISLKMNVANFGKTQNSKTQNIHI